ncbi:DoxX family protein [Pseudomonas alcaligenes]|jgi:putative oxidoreductase|uniref:DoxX family protein n=1 Tax=Aquipseudomonas alcaligenes TaxID=43263 RepID=A0A2V4KLU2_AQUAC|nr:DoxX family protein [Pseudomonas alcaligenes]PYC22651.1 DoxX family protein [Pseudomonas alcaligenes]
MNNLIKTLMSTNAGYGITLLRVVTGLTFAAHGAQKLFGWFGGYGLEGVGQWMESIGITPGYLMALLAGSAEFFGGLALVVGLLVRPAALSLLVSMLVAVFAVHWANGFFMANNGYEYAMILAVISAALMVEGAGKLSLDRRIAG